MLRLGGLRLGGLLAATGLAFFAFLSDYEHFSSDLFIVVIFVPFWGGFESNYER